MPVPGLVLVCIRLHTLTPTPAQLAELGSTITTTYST